MGILINLRDWFAPPPVVSLPGRAMRRCGTSGAALDLAERINQRAADTRFAALSATSVGACGLLRMRAAVLENAAEWLLCRRTLPALASCHLHAARILRQDLRAAVGSCHA